MVASSVEWRFLLLVVTAALAVLVIPRHACPQNFIIDLAEDSGSPVDAAQSLNETGASNSTNLPNTESSTDSSVTDGSPVVGEPVKYADRGEFLERISRTMFSLGGGDFLGFDDKGNVVFGHECNDGNGNCFDTEEKFIEYNAAIIPTHLINNDGFLNICPRAAEGILLIANISFNVDDGCYDESFVVWGVEDLFDASEESKLLESIFVTLAKPAPIIKYRSLSFTNWREEIKTKEYQQNSDIYAIKRIFFGEEYAWSEWVNAEGESAYSANSVIYKFVSSTEVFDYARVCLSDSLNTVFDMSGCFDIVNLDPNLGPIRDYKNAKFMFVGEEWLLGVTAIYSGDRYDLQSRFDAQVWTPMFESFIEGFTYGLTM